MRPFVAFSCGLVIGALGVSIVGCGGSSGAAGSGDLDACAPPADPCRPWHGVSCGLCNNSHEGYAWNGGACGLVGGCDITAPVDPTYELCLEHHASCGATSSTIACDGGLESCGVSVTGAYYEVCAPTDSAGSYRCVPIIAAPIATSNPACTHVCQLE